MSELLILQNPEVAARTSAATRRVLQQRAGPAPYTPFLNAGQMHMLRSLVDTILPQAAVGTKVDIAEAIDRRLAARENAGFRYAVLPPDGEAYRQGLALLQGLIEKTPMQSFDRMPPSAREDYLRCVCNGDVDTVAEFPLSTFLRMLRSDAVRFWIAHPDTMSAMGYFGFADGSTGNEGWQAIRPDDALSFEYPARSVAQQGGAQ